MLTMKDRFGRLDGLKVAIVGDITHSRVARSNIQGLTKLGSHVYIAGPPTMVPPGVERLGNVTACATMKEAIQDADVVMMLRIQQERQGKTLIRIPVSTPLFRAQSDNLKFAKLMRWSCTGLSIGGEVSSYVVDGNQSHSETGRERYG
jgi:aspartate carbamoyltransferase catalytic subunit